MPSSGRDNRFRLASFAQSVWLPAMRGDDSRSVWQHGHALEAFLWLDLGVKVGAFDEAAARELASGGGGRVLVALDEFDRQPLEALFPDHLRQIIRRSFAAGEYFVKDSDAFRGETSLAATFESLMLTAVEHGRDYRTEDLFEQTLFENDLRSPLDDLIVHFASSVGYWIDTDAHFQRILEDRRFDYASRIALVGDAAGIQLWKFNFAVGRVRERVMLVADAAVRGLADPNSGLELGADQLTQSRATLVEELSGLMDRWESRLQLSVGQPSGMM